MSNSYRIRTTPGVDKSIRVRIDQDFEYLEILSLKLLQSEVYTRKCSDYGVIVGRVSINNGFGVPNAKVSIFIPLSSDDEENNPILADLYPYKTLSQTNDIGYRYNLLPTEPSYSNHVPTGSFFTKNDVLTNSTKIEIYDKYYKYNTVTNESGDYMIFGVPVGSQTIVVNVDLSDIGEFSLSPQDMIRMGIATPAQVNGTKFNSSTNLNELPQIITINRTLEVEPLWGDENICNLGITRTDFDLSAERNINIQPTSIFMGSIFSSNEDQPLKRKCKPSLKAGSLCNLVAGPGQIQAIRQTINTDINGRPALEVASLEEGGQLIDDNGTWMFDVPMNLDYVVTNEFGEQVISKDPTKGIPTKGKYRFKIMWNQPPGLGEPIKRANFLVPNVKEYGWTASNGTDPLTNQKVNSNLLYNGDNPCSFSSPPTNTNFKAANASYAFSLDWNDYGPTGTTIGDQMILEAINCQDRFYEMQYNKVYTVSQLISEYRKGSSNNRMISIKNILDDTCESTNNKFPTNDGMYRIDIIFILFQLMINIMYPLIFFIVIMAHLLFWIQCEIILPLVKIIADVVCAIAKTRIGFKATGYYRPFKGLQDNCDKLKNSYNSLKDKCKKTSLKLPNITYPDCELCSCEPQPPVTSKPSGSNPLSTPNSSLADVLIQGSYGGPYNQDDGEFVGGDEGVITESEANDIVFLTGLDVQSPKIIMTKGVPPYITSQSGIFQTFSTDLPWHERFNLFNTKAKYFNNDDTNNPGGGVNRIGVRFNTDLNGGPLSGALSGKHHLDNVIAILVDAEESSNFSVGAMMTFVDPELSTDSNLTNVAPANDLGTTSITGSTIGTQYGTNKKINVISRTVNYANPNGVGSLSETYDITGNTGSSFHKFPIDLEYYQVIENTSVSNYITDADALNPDLPNSFYSRVLNGGTYMVITQRCSQIIQTRVLASPYSPYYVMGNNKNLLPIRNYFINSGSQRVVFLVRGVDPNSPKTTISYDLSRLYGKSTDGHVVRTIPNMRMNIPIQGGFRCVKHGDITNSTLTEGYSGLGLFYDSFMWQPSVNSPGVPVSNDPATGLPYFPPTQDPNYRPVGYCDFQPFSTLNHGYYSTINESTSAPGVYTPSVNGLRIYGDITQIVAGNSAANAYTTTYDEYNPSSTFCNTNLLYPYSNSSAYDNGSSGQPRFDKFNRGYFPNESVEGGNIAYLSATRFETTIFPISGLKYVKSSDSYIKDSGYLSFTYTSIGGLSPLTVNLGSSNRQIVMRSDRLPSSSYQELGITPVSYTLMANNNFSFYIMGDDGTVSSLSGGASLGVGGSADSAASNAENAACGGNVLNTFSCEGLIPLSCYYDKMGQISFYEKPAVIPSTGNESCYGNKETGTSVFGKQPESILEGGCYLLVTKPFGTLNLDLLTLLPEWKARMSVTFAACRNVYSHSFTNNWVNGSLYAFSFANSRRFTPSNSVPISTANKPYNCFCKNNIYFNTDSNNFYYRSSPYNYTQNSFVGRENPKNWFTNKIYNGNKKNLMFPTTIADLGPRDIYTQEIVFSNDYDGYVMKSLNSTTYQDVSELLNVFILSRLTHRSFLSKILGGSPVTKFFSRDNLKIDGDYAQLISINSELGTVPFDSDNYSSCDIFYNGGNSTNGVFGVYFSSNTQIRDYVTPKRTIINDSLPLNLTNCAFEYFKVKTQTVPFYQWYIKKNSNNDDDDPISPLFGPTPIPDSIFGSQLNDWSTENYSGTTFFYHEYQTLDRLLGASRYFRTNGNVESKYYRGNIYSVNNATPPIQDASTAYWDTNVAPDSAYPQMERIVNTGAPFYFYFGLNKGKSAFDRFTKKWIDVDVTTD